MKLYLQRSTQLVRQKSFREIHGIENQTIGQFCLGSPTQKNTLLKNVLISHHCKLDTTMHKSNKHYELGTVQGCKGTCYSDLPI